MAPLVVHVTGARPNFPKAAPVLKALMFLLTHDIFEGTNLGPKDKDNIAVWNAILGEAAQTEQEMRDG